MRKLLAGAALAFLAGGLATPLALAHTQVGVHEYRWYNETRDDPDQRGPGPDAQLSLKDFITMKVNFDDGITWWKVEMRHEASGATSWCEHPLTTAETAATKNQDKYLRCNWDTTRLGDMSALDDDPGHPLGGGPVAPNGVYIISGWAKNGDGYCGVLCAKQPANDLHTLAPYRLEVRNAITAPGGVQRAYNSATRTVTVTWNANPEPDVTKYVVQEKFADEPWKTVGERPGNTFSFDREITQVGSYRYRVSAERQFSEPAISGASEVLEVAATPTTSGDGGPGPEPGSPAAEEPGVTIPTDGSSPGTTGTTGKAGTSGGKSGGKATAEQPRGLFSPGSIFNPYPTARPAARPTTTTTDPGYQEALPYKTPTTEGQDESALPGTEEPQVIKRLVQVPTPKDPRALLVPLAGGLAVFVFAMQLTFALRRRPATGVEDDFGDWTGI